MIHHNCLRIEGIAKFATKARKSFEIVEILKLPREPDDHFAAVIQIITVLRGYGVWSNSSDDERQLSVFYLTLRSTVDAAKYMEWREYLPTYMSTTVHGFTYRAGFHGNTSGK